jgi:Flp pilus assembly pilin Flp
MLHTIKTFAADESGAVTVDWVVLTAALVGLGLAVMGVISTGLQDLSADVTNVMTGVCVDGDDFNVSGC